MHHPKTRVLLLIATTLIVAAAAPARAQAPRVTYSEAQAERGMGLYDDICAGCHGDQLQGDGGHAPALTGADFEIKWMGKPVAAFWNYMTTKMPLDRPGELPAQTYADVFAYVLKKNEVLPGPAEFPPVPADGMIIRRR
jgi:mono/diheme cytochrome c family protein